MQSCHALRAAAMQDAHGFRRSGFVSCFSGVKPELHPVSLLLTTANYLLPIAPGRSHPPLKTEALQRDHHLTPSYRLATKGTSGTQGRRYSDRSESTGLSSAARSA